MIGETYWTVGIELKYIPYHGGEWIASINFYDAGFCQDESTEGTLHNRYHLADPVEAIKFVLQDAIKLGIEFKNPIERDNIPRLYWPEAETSETPDNWREILSDIAKKAGVQSAYERREYHE